MSNILNVRLHLTIVNMHSSFCSLFQNHIQQKNDALSCYLKIIKFKGPRTCTYTSLRNTKNSFVGYETSYLWACWPRISKRARLYTRGGQNIEKKLKIRLF